MFCRQIKYTNVDWSVFFLIEILINIKFWIIEYGWGPVYARQNCVAETPAPGRGLL